MAVSGVPLMLVGAVVPLSDEEIAEQLKNDPWMDIKQAVVIYLGDHEVARITGRDLSFYDGRVIVDETVARWLAGKLK